MKPVLKTELMKRLRPKLAAAPYHNAPKLVIGVSGGRDSVVLLDVMQRMQHVHQSPLEVVHVDHHTGPFATQARQLVFERCEEYQLPFHVADFRWDGLGNFEHLASEFRRQVMWGVSGEHGYVVLAHHAEDQSETLLMALARGAGITSPLGMHPEKDRRLRPLLRVGSALLADHAEKADLTWCEDPSNADTQRFRNAVRHQIMPVLSAFHQDIGARLGGWVEEYHQLQTHLFQQARRMVNQHGLVGELGRGGWLKRELFERQPGYLWPFVLAVFWQSLGVQKPKRREHEQLVYWLEQRETGCFDHGGRRVYCDVDGLAFEDKPELLSDLCRLDNTTSFGLWRLRLEWVGQELPWTHHLKYQGFQWITGLPLPKSWRERLRRARLPLRVRQHLPGVRVGNQQLHFGELLALQKQGHLRLVRESGPEWQC